MNTPITVVVDRQTWFRGHGAIDSRLLLPGETPRMCCMGFLCKVMGFTDAEIYDVPALDVVEDIKSIIPTEWNYNESNFRALYGINDNPGISDATREDALIAHAKQFDIHFEFVN